MLAHTARMFETDADEEKSDPPPPLVAPAGEESMGEGGPKERTQPETPESKKDEHEPEDAHGDGDDDGATSVIATPAEERDEPNTEDRKFIKPDSEPESIGEVSAEESEYELTASDDGGDAPNAGDEVQRELQQRFAERLKEEAMRLREREERLQQQERDYQERLRRATQASVEETAKPGEKKPGSPGRSTQDDESEKAGAETKPPPNKRKTKPPKPTSARTTPTASRRAVPAKSKRARRRAAERKRKKERRAVKRRKRRAARKARRDARRARKERRRQRRRRRRRERAKRKRAHERGDPHCRSFSQQRLSSSRYTCLSTTLACCCSCYLLSAVALTSSPHNVS